jgi:phage terminase large subunit GpA-like protein
MHRRFLLVKGDGVSKSIANVKLQYPDTSGRKDRGESRGDVPVLFINTDRMKDEMDADLRRETGGDRYIHFPKWLPANIYDEITNEERSEQGKWSATGRNEGWDLLIYAEAGGLVLDPPIDAIDWQNPPAWAKDWHDNALVSKTDPVQQAVQPKQPQRRLSMRAA